jgi:hypothetical protein
VDLARFTTAPQPVATPTMPAACITAIVMQPIWLDGIGSTLQLRVRSRLCD